MTRISKFVSTLTVRNRVSILTNGLQLENRTGISPGSVARSSECKTPYRILTREGCKPLSIYSLQIAEHCCAWRQQ